MTGCSWVSHRPRVGVDGCRVGILWLCGVIRGLGPCLDTRRIDRLNALLEAGWIRSCRMVARDVGVDNIPWIVVPIGVHIGV